MNTPYKPNEEELTAYVLGEVDETQKAAIDEAIVTQPETKALLDDIRETIELSEGLFAHAVSETLSPEQRDVLESAASNVIRLPKRRTWHRVVGYAAAAGIVSVIGASVIGDMPRAREAARRAIPGQLALQSDFERQIVLEEVEHRSSKLTQGPVDMLQRSDDGPASGLGGKNKENEALGGHFYGDAAVQAPEGTVMLGDESANGVATLDPGKPMPQSSPLSKLKPAPLRNSSSHVASEPPALLVTESRELRQSEVDQLRSLGYVTEGEVPVEEVQQLRRPIVEKKKITTLASSSQQIGQPKTQIYMNNAPATTPPQVPGQTNHNWRRVPAADGQGGAQPSDQTVKRMAMTPMKRGRTETGIQFEASTVSNEFKVEEVEQLKPLGYLGSADSVPILDDIPAEPRFKVAGVPPQDQRFITPGTEAYEFIVENRFKKAAEAPLSTFSIDVDTASYSNMRRFIRQGSMPPVDSIRIEELINYFNYDYPQPVGVDPFSSSIEVASAPWNPAHKLVRVGLKGKDIPVEERPNSNLVFLLDVSGSMNSADKLPLVRQSIRLLTQQLTENDRIAIVVYAGNSGLVLPSTRGDQHNVILDALNRLNTGGSTNGGAGIQLAYDVAAQNFIDGGVNRVILASDGDFNVGMTSRSGLVDLIEQKAKSGVFLSVLGYGMGNLKDATMENLADRGNGNYAYIDTFHEAKKVLADEINATLFTIAKDVKIQVEFNPSRVHAYRLIGYENRALANRDFNDDTKDAGEIGAGHTVTALYEIVPTGIAAAFSGNVDALRYKTIEEPVVEKRIGEDRVVRPETSNEMLTLKLRYKQPDGNTSKLLTFHIEDRTADYAGASADFKFATAVAAYGMKLRNSPFAQSMTYDTVLSLAESGRGHDLNGYRSEFIDLVRRTKTIAPRYVPRDPRRY